MSRREGANAVLFGEKPGPVLCHLRAPIVPKLGTHSYGQNLISIELNPNCFPYVILSNVPRSVLQFLVSSRQPVSPYSYEAGSA